MKKKSIICLLLIIILCGCSILTPRDNIKFKEEYEKLNDKTDSTGNQYLTLNIEEDNYIKYLTIEESMNIIKSGTGVIYIGSSQCQTCRNIISVLLDSASETALEEIYYLDVTKEMDVKNIDSEGNIYNEQESTKEYQKLVKLLDNILDDYILTDSTGKTYNTKEKRIVMPLVIFVYEGEISLYHQGSLDTHIDYYQELTTEEKNTLKEIYLEGIHKVLNDICLTESDDCE